MSFSRQIKNEICANKQLYPNWRAQLWGLALFGKMFGMQEMSIRTEHPAVARMYAKGIGRLVRLRDAVQIQEFKRARRTPIYTASVESEDARLALLTDMGLVAENRRIPFDRLEEHERPAFLSGVFLACAGISDPTKSYRVEFTVTDRLLCDDLALLLSEMLAEPKRSERRNEHVLYYKESEQVEDLVTCIGAAKSTLALMEIKMVKELRNKVNRETNCETANLSKTIDAAVLQVQAIKRIQAQIGLEALPEELRELALLRLQSPELSLRELGSRLSVPLSRSGVNHRIQRLIKLADELAPLQEEEINR